VLIQHVRARSVFHPLAARRATRHCQQQPATAAGAVFKNNMTVCTRLHHAFADFDVLVFGDFCD